MAKQDKTICIVDDDDAVRESVAALLRVSNFRTHCLTSPQELLDADFKADLDCLIVDMRLPAISGIELLKRLAADGFHIPAIVISGHLDYKIDAQLARMPDVQFLAKPCDPQTLLSLVESAVSKRK